MALSVFELATEREALFADCRSDAPSFTQCYTQIKIGDSIESPIFFYSIAKSLETPCFHNKHNWLVLPCSKGLTSPFPLLTTCEESANYSFCTCIPREGVVKCFIEVKQI